MVAPIVNIKYLCLITAALTLGASHASSHPIEEPNHTAIGHVLSGSEHLVLLVVIGVVTGCLMLTRKRPQVLAGNIGLIGFIVYETYSHASASSLLQGLEFFVVATIISLIAWRGVYLCVPVIRWIVKSFRPISHRYLCLADNYIGFPDAKAHCDIPCKIYDPAVATISALSVIRLIDIINETLAAGDQGSADFQNTMSRCVQRKEEESEKLKQEVRIIWGDYFKEPQFESFPELHELTHKIMMLASAAKQKVDREEALTLLESVNTFSEIFWATKGVDTERKTAPYPPSLEVVRPKL